MSSRKRAAPAPADDATPATTTRPRVDRVVVNVGGTLFTTSASTLTAASSYFQRVLSDRWAADDGDLFLDRSPEPFAFILDYMRNHYLELPEDNAPLARRILLEAEFLGVDSILFEVKATAHHNLHSEWEGADAAAVAAFDEEHGSLADALRTRVLPARYFSAPPPPPPPPRCKILQTMPAPPGCRVVIRHLSSDDSGEASQTFFAVDCLALVEDPTDLSLINHGGCEAVCGGSRLDAFITHHTSYGHILASEAYGKRNCGFELRMAGQSKDQFLALPQDMNLQAEFWKNKDEHSEGTFERNVRMLRFSVDEDGDQVIQAVDIGETDGMLTFKEVSEWNNFKRFKF